MTCKPKLSVIVPVYNAERFLHECIESILNQSYRDFELILVDDGSADGSGKICDEYARENERITVIHQANEGQSSARNRGLNVACGEYIGFVDSDDIIEPDMYEKLMDAILKSNAEMSVCALKYVDETGNFLSTNIDRSCGERYEVVSSHDVLCHHFDGEYENSLFVCPTTKVYLRQLLGDTPFRVGVISEDDLLANTLWLKEYKVAIIHEALYCYRMNPASTTHRKFGKERVYFLNILKERFAVLSENGFSATANTVAKVFAEMYIEFYFRSEAVGHIEWLTEYKETFYKMFVSACKSEMSVVDKIKFIIRFCMFTLSPKVYKRFLIGDKLD